MKTISERARDIVRSERPERYQRMSISASEVTMGDLLQALDEWQADIEERMAALELLNSTFEESWNEQGFHAARECVDRQIRGRAKPKMPRVPPTPVDESGRTDPAAEAERARANTHADRYNAARFEEEKLPTPRKS